MVVKHSQSSPIPNQVLFMGTCMRKGQIGPNGADAHLNTDYSVTRSLTKQCGMFLVRVAGPSLNSDSFLALFSPQTAHGILLVRQKKHHPTAWRVALFASELKTQSSPFFFPYFAAPVWSLNGILWALGLGVIPDQHLGASTRHLGLTSDVKYADVIARHCAASWNQWDDRKDTACWTISH